MSQQHDDHAIQILSNEGAQCGTCGDEPGDRNCPDCEKFRAGYVAALRAAGWAPQPEHEAMAAEIRRLRAAVAAVIAEHEKGEHNGLAICLHCASQMFPPPETGIWSESAYPCATLRALGITEDAAAVSAARP